MFSSVVSAITSILPKRSPSPPPPTAKKQRLGPKRKVAILFSYNGTPYQGMQMNPGAHTIEGVLFDALIKIQAVSQDNSDDPKKVALMRCARTDKGVHALGQVVSIKLIEKANTKEELNQVLPKGIHVLDVVRVANGFHAKNACESRIYEYLMPVIHANVDEERMRRIATLMEGTHNFHNYTIGKRFEDPSAMRHLRSIKVDKVDGNWRIRLHGNSFMMHQIRKMVTAMIICSRINEELCENFIEKTFQSTKVNIPKAPGLGLMLYCCCFDGFNKRMEGLEREGLGFEPYAEEMEKFKEEQIYPEMLEQLEESFEGWMEYCSEYLDALEAVARNKKAPEELK